MAQTTQCMDSDQDSQWIYWKEGSQWKQFVNLDAGSLMLFSHICTYKSTFLISDNIKARRDIWLVGDTFVTKLWPTVNSAKSKAAMNFTSQPYLLDSYNLHPCYPGNTVSAKSKVGHMLNEVVKALNAEIYLPSHIFILPDKDIIEDVHFGGFGCKIIFERLLQWLTKNIELVLDIRKSDLKANR